LTGTGTLGLSLSSQRLAVDGFAASFVICRFKTKREFVNIIFLGRKGYLRKLRVDGVAFKVAHP
jgi:hypothetical protein